MLSARASPHFFFFFPQQIETFSTDELGGINLIQAALSGVPLIGDLTLQLRLDSTAQPEGYSTLNVNARLVKPDGDVLVDQKVFKDIPLDFHALCDEYQYEVPSVVDDLTLGMIDTQLIAHGMYARTTDLARIRAKLRDVNLANFRGMLQGANVAGVEFPEPFDICPHGVFELPPITHEFFEFAVSDFFGGLPPCLGPICFDGGVALHGAVGVYERVSICIFSLRGTVWLQPWGAAEASGFFALSLGPLQAGIRIVARILETGLPTFFTAVFREWPLKICTGSDLEMTPLSARLEVFLRIRICIWKCFTKTLIRATLWKWSMRATSRQLWRTCKDEPDPTRPRFPRAAIAPANHWSYKPMGDLMPDTQNCRVFDWDASCTEGEGKVDWPEDNTPPTWQPETACYIGSTPCDQVRNKYNPPDESNNGPGWVLPPPTTAPPTAPPPPSSGREATGCTVVQLSGRAADRPALKLVLNDDYPEPDSRISNITYSVGTFIGGRDVVARARLWHTSTGGSEVFSFDLHRWARDAVGIPLFFTVEEANAADKVAVLECVLPSYDSSPPVLTVTDLHAVQSNPSKVSVLYSVADDTPFAQLQYSFGRGPGSDSNIQWTGLDLVEFNRNGSDVVQALDMFAAPIPGRLLYHTGDPTVVTASSAAACAGECIHYKQDVGCHSFDYDTATRICSLHHTVAEDHEAVRLIPVGDHQYYARTSSANVHTQRGTIVLEDLALTMGGTYHFNMRARNQLGYEATISSTPMVIDLTPPSTGIGGLTSGICAETAWYSGDKCVDCLCGGCFR